MQPLQATFESFFHYIFVDLLLRCIRDSSRVETSSYMLRILHRDTQHRIARFAEAIDAQQNPPLVKHTLEGSSGIHPARGLVTAIIRFASHER